MSPTPLEDQVHDALHRTADPLQRAPFTVTDVRTRARRIQRRRAVVAGAAVAAVLAIAIPVGAGVVGPSPRSDVPPATAAARTPDHRDRPHRPAHRARSAPRSPCPSSTSTNRA